MYRAMPVPMPGNEKKGPGDTSGLWRVKVEEFDAGWKFRFYVCETGVLWDEVLKECSRIENELKNE